MDRFTLELGTIEMDALIHLVEYAWKTKKNDLGHVLRHPMERVVEKIRLVRTGKSPERYGS